MYKENVKIKKVVKSCKVLTIFPNHEETNLTVASCPGWMRTNCHGWDVWRGTAEAKAAASRGPVVEALPRCLQSTGIS